MKCCRNRRISSPRIGAGPRKTDKSEQVGVSCFDHNSVQPFPVLPDVRQNAFVLVLPAGVEFKNDGIALPDKRFHLLGRAFPMAIIASTSPPPSFVWRFALSFFLDSGVSIPMKLTGSSLLEPRKKTRIVFPSTTLETLAFTSSSVGENGTGAPETGAAKTAVKIEQARLYLFKFSHDFPSRTDLSWLCPMLFKYFTFLLWVFLALNAHKIQ